jgi:hypothetical protein
MLLAYYAAFRSGWANAPRTDLAAVLGRAPIRSLDAVRKAVADFARLSTRAAQGRAGS